MLKPLIKRIKKQTSYDNPSRYRKSILEIFHNTNAQQTWRGRKLPQPDKTHIILNGERLSASL